MPATRVEVMLRAANRHPDCAATGTKPRQAVFARVGSVRISPRTPLRPSASVGAHPPRPPLSPQFIAGTVGCVLVAMLWRATRSYPTQLLDLYPLYYGAKAWLHGGNAYVLDAVAPAADRAHLLYQVGNVYPLPAVLLVLPLSFLSPTVAATIWVGCLTGGLLLALRLTGLPTWLALYVPLLACLRLEQYTVFVIILQIVALWAYREHRLWLLAFCCALILTKPNHGLIFVLVMLLLARHWRQQLVAGAAVWGGSMLLDPHWLQWWISTVLRHQEVTHQPVFWQLALLAIPLLLIRDYISGALVLQFLLEPFPGMYVASAVPLGVLGDRRSKYLIPASFLTLPAYASVGQAWATVLALILPMVLLAFLRWWEGREGRLRTILPATAPAEARVGELAR